MFPLFPLKVENIKVDVYEERQKSRQIYIFCIVSQNKWESGNSGNTQRNPRKIRVCRVPTHKMQKWEQEGVGTVELDLKKLNQDIATLRKNRENVPLELLKTKYKKPYAKLKEEIRAQFEIYVKHLIMLGILKTGPDLTGAKAQSMVDQIQKIIDEEKAAGHQKEVTHAVFEEFNLAKAENLACGYYTDRVKYEAYAPYWLEHIHQGPDGKVTSDLLPGMTWHPEAGVWVSFSEPSFTLMMPPTQAGIDAQHKEDTERFKKYLKEVRQE